jgi:hypothetical protein
MPAKPRGERAGAWVVRAGRPWWESAVVWVGEDADHHATRAEVALWRLARLHSRALNRANADAAGWLDAYETAERERAEARADAAALRAAFPPAPPLPTLGCECQTCQYLVSKQAEAYAERVPRTCSTCKHDPGDDDDCHACDACVAGSGWEART